MPDRADAFLLGAGRILQAASEMYGDVLDHPGELGDAREVTLAAQLEKFLPRRYTLATGVVLGPRQTHSAQQDIVIFDRDAYPVFSYGSGLMVVPESLYGTLSVKSRLRSDELGTCVEDAARLKAFVADACPARGEPLHGVVGYRTDGPWESLLNAYVAHVETAEDHRRIDFICDLTGHLCLDATIFGDPERLPPSIRPRSHVMGMRHRACVVEVPQSAFPDLYKILLHALSIQVLGSAPTYTVSSPLEAEIPVLPEVPPPFHATFSGKSVDLVLIAGQAGQFSAIYLNDGSEPWIPGRIFLSAAEPPNPEGWRGQRAWASGWFSAEHYATISATVGPGQNGFFIYDVFVPPGTAPGTYRFYAEIRTSDGRVISDLRWAHTAYVR